MTVCMCSSDFSLVLDEEVDGPENSEIKMKVYNVAQDIVYHVSNSKKLTPKHIGLCQGFIVTGDFGFGLLY